MKPKIAAKKPVAVELKAGQKYHFCTCGESANQPFCDGSHQGTGFTPQAFTAEKDGEAYLCQCKYTSNPPYCDGTHARLDEIADEHPEAVATKAWKKVAEVGEFDGVSSKVVTVGTREIVVTKRDGVLGAIDNSCPHQGGPLGEGSVTSDGCLQCPWHGWTFDPFTGEGEQGSVSAYRIEERSDGIYIELEEEVAQRTVSDLMAETMVNWGITHVFGMVGHSNLGLAEALRKLEAAGKITFIGIRHEGAAAFACSGFAKASGKPAACLTIAGPGATNLLTGIWDAKVDRHPLLALTGQVQTQVLGPGAFQELDLAAAFDAATIWSQTVLHESQHAELMTLALKNALIERGPTHLIFPDEVQVLPEQEGATPSGPKGRISPSNIAPPEESITAALEKIESARNPSIIVGYGARESMGDVLQLAEDLQAPVLTTFKAKGQIADSHPLAAGVLGRSGTPVAAGSMKDSDLLIVFGATFATHTGIDPEIPTIQVDFDRMVLGKFHPVDVPIWGDISTTIKALRSRLDGTRDKSNSRAVLANRWQEWREEKARRANKNQGKGLASAAIFHVLSDLIPEDAVISVDVGNNTYSFGRYFECRGNQKVLMSG